MFGNDDKDGRGEGKERMFGFARSGWFASVFYHVNCTIIEFI